MFRTLGGSGIGLGCGDQFPAAHFPGSPRSALQESRDFFLLSRSLGWLHATLRIKGLVERPSEEAGAEGREAGAAHTSTLPSAGMERKEATSLHSFAGTAATTLLLLKTPLSALKNPTDSDPNQIKLQHWGGLSSQTWMLF